MAPSAAYRRPGYVHVILFIGSQLALYAALLFLDFIMFAFGVQTYWAQITNVFIIYAVMAVLNTFVGYRMIDTLFNLVPIYNIVYWYKIWWRVTSLPFAYWEDGVVAQSGLRKRVYRDALDMKVPKSTAELVAMALIPMEDARRPSAQMAADLQNMIGDATYGVRNARGNDDLHTIAVDAVRSYAELAAHHQDEYYTKAFNNLLRRHNELEANASLRFGANAGPTTAAPIPSVLPQWLQELEPS